MFNFFGKKDSQIQEDVVNELKWDPCVNEMKIKVSAEDGIVTLRGNAPHFFDKTMAEEIALGVGGVKAVANEIEVVLMNDYMKSDEEIAQAALDALKWDYTASKEDIKVAVSNGRITLTGETEWNYQRSAAMNAVVNLMGVVAVNNEINLKPKLQSGDIKTQIQDALRRSAEVEGRKIEVVVKGDHIILSGNVHSNGEVADAEFAAWSAPGTKLVENNLTVSQ
jgi:osmotically-inducible protein OsmY